MGLRQFEGRATQDFTVPAGSGSYATEILYLVENVISDDVNTAEELALVNELQVNVDTLTTDATVEIDILKPGGDPAEADDWRTAVYTYATAGLKDILTFARWLGVRIRVKSGGTDDTTTLDVSWQG
jgi:hypothetical protein